MASDKLLSRVVRFSSLALVVAACGLPGLDSLSADDPSAALDGSTGDDDNDDAGDDDTAGSETDDSNDDGVAPGIQFDFDCIKIDRAEKALVVPPAGLRVNFRVRDCNGDPVPALSPDNLRIINDEKGEEFGAGKEGGGISDLGIPTSYGLLSVIALDMSDSIFKRDALDHVIDGALTYLDQIAITPSEDTKHEVAVIAFGRPEAYEVVQPFTFDHDLVREKIEALRRSESRGSTDLYGAYLEALKMAGTHAMDYELSERFFVLLTDGTHESGNETELRKAALAAKSGTPAHIYVIGIEGNYDAKRLAELTTTAENFVHVDDALALQHAFAGVAKRVDAAARSNYVVGVCTPIALGEDSSLTIQVRMDGSDGSKPVDEVTLPYSVALLNGDIASCDPYDIAHNQLACDDDGVCEIACVAMDCGCDGGVRCGTCGDGTMCSEDNVCVAGEGPGPGEDSCGNEAEDLPGVRGIYVDIVEANQGVGIKLASGTTVVEPAKRNAPLVGSRPLTVRAGWRLDTTWIEQPVLGRLHVYNKEGVAQVFDNTLTVAAASSFNRLDASFHWRVPAEAVQPGSSYSISFHTPEPATPGTSQPKPPRLPEMGTADLGVPTGRMRTHVTLVPVRHAVNGCDQTGDPQKMLTAFHDGLYSQYATDEVQLVVSPRVYTFTQPLTRNGWTSLVTGLAQQRTVDNARPDTFYYGVVRACGSTDGIAGVGFVPWNAGSLGSSTHRTSVGFESVRVFVHELGHNHGRQHVGCSGGEAGVDANYPHPAGAIGVWGHDVQTLALYGPDRKDFMSYCGNNWISDYGWKLSATTTSQINSWASSGRSLTPDERILVGVVNADGQTQWWTAPGRVESTPRADAPPLEFYAGDELVAAVVPEYSQLSDDSTLVITASLPSGFDQVTRLRHIAAMANLPRPHDAQRVAWSEPSAWLSTSIDDVNLLAR